MLQELVVENLGVIDRVEISFGPGSSVLTGETGAGKTLLVTALGLLLGAQSDKEAVRQGQVEGRVEAMAGIDGDDLATAFLKEIGVLEDATPQQVTMTRTISAEGKPSRCRINGRVVTIAQLATAATLLVRIAGQNEHTKSIGPARRRAIVDAYAGPVANSLAQEIEREMVGAERAKERVEAAEVLRDAGSRESELLRHEIDEIEAAEIQVGELDRLRSEARVLANAAEISEAVSRTGEIIGGDGAVVDQLSTAAAEIGKAAELNESLAGLADRLRSVELELVDISSELAAVVVEADPGRGEQIQERISVVSRLLRRFGPDEANVLEHLVKAQARVQTLETSTEAGERAQAEMEGHEQRARAAAEKLSQIRTESIANMTAEVRDQLTRLALPDARFEIDLVPSALYRGGLEHIDFNVALNPGEPPRSLASTASGGELSRVALALDLVTRSPEVGTLVFDEVDAGVGGQAAREVGRCLAELGRTVQVLVVTHLPQVAAFADNHLRVLKVRDGDRATAIVEQVRGDERLEELSRMLAGLPESARAREHAQELLDLATATP